MTERKAVLNVTVAESIAADARAEAAENGTTISSVVEKALAEHLKWFRIRQEGLAAIEEDYRENGYPTPEEVAAAKARVDEEERLVAEMRARRERQSGGTAA
jgi:hypothetical protein